MFQIKNGRNTDAVHPDVGGERPWGGGGGGGEADRVVRGGGDQI